MINNTNEEYSKIDKIKFHQKLTHKVKTFYNKQTIRKLYTIAITLLIGINIFSLTKYYTIAEDVENQEITQENIQQTNATTDFSTEELTTTEKIGNETNDGINEDTPTENESNTTYTGEYKEIEIIQNSSEGGNNPANTIDVNPNTTEGETGNTEPQPNNENINQSQESTTNNQEVPEISTDTSDNIESEYNESTTDAKLPENEIQEGFFINSNSLNTMGENDNTAILLTGSNFNTKIKDLSKNRDNYYDIDDVISDIKSIQKSENLNTSLTDYNLISLPGTAPVRAWFDNTNNSGILYFYTEPGITIKMNTDSSFMFQNLTDLQNISGLSEWDASEVTNMSSMFNGCPGLYNISALSNWNTNNVTNMSNMFKNCSNLQDVSGLSLWKTDKITNTSSMFSQCISLSNINLSNWNTSNLTNMSSMFQNCNNLKTITLGNWETNNTDYIRTNNMFQNCNNLKTIYSNTFNINKIGSSANMFENDTNLIGGKGTKYNQNYTNITGAKIDGENGQRGYFTKPHATFLPGQNFNQTIKSLAGDTNPTDGTPNTTIKYITQTGIIPSRITNTGLISESTSAVPVIAWFDNGTIYYYTQADEIYLNSNSNHMFSELRGLIKIDMNSWNTSDVKKMNSMFAKCTSLQSLDTSNWNTSNLTTTNMMFDECSSLRNLDFSNWNTNNITNMGYMFPNCTNLEIINLSNWNTSKVTNMSSMFANCTNLTTIYADTGFITAQTNGNDDIMFYNNTSLIGGKGTRYNQNYTDSTYARIDGYNGLSGYFTKPHAMLLPGQELNITLKTLAGQNVLNYTDENYNISQIIQTGNISSGTINTGLISTPTSAIPVIAWFDNGTIYYYTQADEIYLNPDSSHAFHGLKYLQQINLSGFDTSKVINMSYMFYECEMLNNIDLNNWDTSIVNDMSYMFYDGPFARNLSINNWNTQMVNNMEGMFSKNKFNHKLDLNGRKTNKVTNMSYMFSNCEANSLDISNWNTDKVTNMNHMFENSDLRSFNISNRNTNKVTNMNSMFAQAKITNLDINNWDVSNVTGMNSMFSGCNNLTNLNLNHWNTSKVSDTSYMFNNCTNLTTIYVNTGFITSGVTNSSNMFAGDTNLKGGNGTTYSDSKTDNEYARIDGYNGLSGYFTEPYAILLSGDDFNIKIKKLTNENIQHSYERDHKITQILQTKSIPSGETIVISSSTSPLPIIARFDNERDIVYYYTEANKIYLNSDSSNMFNSFYELTYLDTNNLDTSKVTNMSRMFESCQKLYNLDLSNWNTNKVINMEKMFNGCSNLQTIYASTGFITTQTSSGNDMFIGNPRLKGGNGTIFNENYVDKNYARIDGENGLPGYFSSKDKYTITFDSDGGNKIDPLTLNYGVSIIAPIPTKNCYNFVEWENLPSNMPAYNITIKAKWNYIGCGGGDSSGGGSSGGGSSGKGNSSSGGGKKIVSTQSRGSDPKNIPINEKENKEIKQVKIHPENNTKESKIPALDMGKYNTSYSFEMNKAYQFAYANGITTKPTIINANMNGNITRIQMAKMLSYYAINVLGKSPDISKGSIKFNDVSNKLDKQYNNAVTLAYQLGIMGVGTKNFRPKDEVTRAEFVTALSRMLYNIKDGSGKTKYYEPHIAKLYNEGIINNTNPGIKEKKGYVMVMLMRSVEL